MGPTPKYLEFCHTAPILLHCLGEGGSRSSIYVALRVFRKGRTPASGACAKQCRSRGLRDPLANTTFWNLSVLCFLFPWSEHSEVYKVERAGWALTCLLSLLPFDRDALWPDALGSWCHGVYIIMGMDHMSPATLSQKKPFATKIVRAPLHNNRKVTRAGTFPDPLCG